ncbi:hypothetical protein [Pseudomonas entomophila]|uniref:hypothetical protein n=1 Tax=Pseudomonas entomophila TaxID=312306 RepID=UPI003EBAAD2C
MDTNKMREEFEAAWRERYPDHPETMLKPSVFKPENYCNMRVDDAWWAWQASRENLRVTNPFPVVDGDPEVMWAHAKARKSLETQGFKVTP